MLVMAKSYYKLHKYEWMKKLWEMMQANGASERREGRDLPAARLPRGRRRRTSRAPSSCSSRRPRPSPTTRSCGTTSARSTWRPRTTPTRRRCSSGASQLQPGFAKAHLNLGDAYRGVKQHEKAQEEYQKALQLFPNYADAVFNLGILYLDADKMPNMDLFAKENAAIQYFQKYKQMMGGTLPPSDPAEAYIAEAQDKIKKEEKRLDRLKKQQEREAARAAKKAADDAKKAAAAAGQPAPGAPGATPAPPAPPAARGSARAPGAAARPAGPPVRSHE